MEITDVFEWMFHFVEIRHLLSKYGGFAISLLGTGFKIGLMPTCFESYLSVTESIFNFMALLTFRFLSVQEGVELLLDILSPGRGRLPVPHEGYVLHLFIGE